MLVLSCGPCQIPGMEEDVGGVELVYRPVQRELADVWVCQHPRCRRWVIEKGLHAVAVHRPRRHRVMID
jgi:hypothetical protein